MDRALFVSRCTPHISGVPSTTGEPGKDFSAILGRLQPQASLSTDSLTVVVSFHRTFSVAKRITSGAKVKMLQATDIHLFNTRMSPLVERHMSITNVGEVLDVSLTSIDVGEFTLEKGPVNVMIVQSPFIKVVLSLNTVEFTLEKDFLSLVNVRNHLGTRISSFPKRKSTLEKSYMSVLIVVSH